MMRSNPFPVVLVLLGATFGLTAGCGSDSPPAPAHVATAAVSRLPTRPTHLPLQPNAPAVGGDVDAPIRDVVRLALTEQQAEQIATGCKKTAEIVVGDNCEQVVRLGLKANSNLTACELCVSVTEFSVRNQVPRTLLEIVDQRPGRPLCGDGPDGLCLVLPVDAAAVTSLANAAATTQNSPQTPPGIDPPPTPTTPEPPPTTPAIATSAPPAPDTPLRTSPDPSS